MRLTNKVGSTLLCEFVYNFQLSADPISVRWFKCFTYVFEHGTCSLQNTIGLTIPSTFVISSTRKICSLFFSFAYQSVFSDFSIIWLIVDSGVACSRGAILIKSYVTMWSARMYKRLIKSTPVSSRFELSRDDPSLDEKSHVVPELN